MVENNNEIRCSDVAMFATQGHGMGCNVRWRADTIGC